MAKTEKIAFILEQVGELSCRGLGAGSQEHKRGHRAGLQAHGNIRLGLTQSHSSVWVLILAHH
jgi:hypothetical protein